MRYEHEFDTKIIIYQFIWTERSKKCTYFRVNRVDQVDSNGPRDLISGDFNNFGLEAKFLNHYAI